TVSTRFRKRSFVTVVMAGSAKPSGKPKSKKFLAGGIGIALDILEKESRPVFVAIYSGDGSQFAIPVNLIFIHFSSPISSRSAIHSLKSVQLCFLFCFDPAILIHLSIVLRKRRSFHGSVE